MYGVRVKETAGVILWEVYDGTKSEGLFETQEAAQKVADYLNKKGNKEND